MTDYDMDVLVKRVKESLDNMTTATSMRELCYAYDSVLASSKTIFEDLVRKLDDKG